MRITDLLDARSILFECIAKEQKTKHSTRSLISW